jgi:hypothetical protein
MYSEFGHPLGPDYLRNSITLQRHDPAAVLVNGLRQLDTMLDTPIRPVSRAGADVVVRIARAVGVDPQDRAITSDGTFPDETWYPSEGKAAFPVQALLLLAASAAVLVRPAPVRGAPAGPRRLRLRPRGYGTAGARRVLVSALALAAIGHMATVKWSPWGNRIGLYIVVVAASLAGLWLAPVRLHRLRRVASRPRRVVSRLLAAATAVLLVVGGAAGWASAAYGWPRRLVGSQSVFVLDRWDSLFVTRQQWADDYAAVGRAVRASGARRIGIVQDNDTWEYPWWLMFRGRTLLAMQSQLPHRRPATGEDIDAIVCSSSAQTCWEYTPPGWPITQVGVLRYALPPPPH